MVNEKTKKPGIQNANAKKAEKVSVEKPNAVEKSSQKDVETKEKVSTKQEKKNGEKSSTPSKTEAVVHGRSLPISTKHAIAVCDAIRNKDVESALTYLTHVSSYRQAIPMRGEIPHRKGDIMSGRYPIKTVAHFIKLLHSVRANALAHDMPIESCRLGCVANLASRPYKRFGQAQQKRTHVSIKLTLDAR